jgi:hypothetical protein
MISKTYFKTKDYVKVKFMVRPEQADSVAIVGLNGDWKTLIYMSRKKDGNFTADVSLPKNSQHEFKYLVNDNEWLVELEADSQNQNPFGTVNSVLVIE